VTKTPKTAYITLDGSGAGNATSLSFEVRDTNGAVLPGSQSSVACGADAQPPTAPGQPSGASTAPGAIDLTWDAATDDIATSLTYHVYRDGGSTPVGTVKSSSPTVSFTDTGLAGGSTHTYEVDASDGTNTGPKSPPSDPIQVMEGTPGVFSDGFDSGLTQWTSVTNLTLDSSTFGAAAPSARAAVSGSKGYAFHDLGATFPSLCLSAGVNVSSLGTNSVALLKLRAGTASIGRVFVDANRVLKVRGDVSGATFSSGVQLPTGWNTLELCATTGTSGSLSLSLNGSAIGSWSTNMGTNPISRLQIGDEAAKTVTVNFDDVVASQ
jgi:hypothetical protein